MLRAIADGFTDDVPDWRWLRISLETPKYSLRSMAPQCVVLALALCATTSWAAQFTIDATIVCPGNVISATDARVNTAFPANVTLERCSGLRVIALDSTLGRDGYCGAGYTDSHGHVHLVADWVARMARLPTST